ncbi:hypothetical protein GW764_02170 [Candidatus Parcubacteria bacterium]|nr:hypothetical protein [Candidatus Parcubacteria bacterium]
MEITKLILEIINTVAIGVGAFMAVVGINAWKKQLKGSTEYELARRYLKAVYKVRDAIKYVRNPFISVEEMTKAYEENNINDPDFSDNRKTNRAVYSVRWEKVIDARTDLDVELLEAEVIWGKKAIEVASNLNAQITKLYVSLKFFLEERKVKPDRDIIYDMGDEDKFNPELNKAIEEIEELLKPHLK